MKKRQNLNLIDLILCPVFTIAAIYLFSTPTCFAQSENLNVENSSFWKEHRPGLSSATFFISPSDSVIKTDVLLLKIDPKLFSCKLVLPEDMNKAVSDIRSMVKYANGLIGINAHFFDPSSKPLGLIIQDGKILQKKHMGGKTLSGVFYIENSAPKIAYRNEELPLSATLAFQAGPRLVTNHQPTELSTNDFATRRSGIAITDDGYILIFATQLRYPGATLIQIQQMLLDPRLGVKDAMNLDGGSSSQVFVEQGVIRAKEEIFISGGDAIPVGLIFQQNSVLQ